MNPMEEAGYRPTECGCKKDVRSCRRPGCLGVGDLARLREQLGEEFLRGKIVASDGALVMNRATGKTFQIPTMTPAKVGGWCVFLVEGRCSIHAIKPQGCAYFDVHMKKAEGARRSRTMHAAIAGDEQYFRDRRELVRQGLEVHR